MSIVIYQHPDGQGCIEFDGGSLIAANDLDATVTRILIGPDGLRDLAYRLGALADVIDGRPE
ncbi:hypothetical protein [Thauera sp. 63]|uniref:hypothetical protein n=1 Tax=Thauera sp. 63 TaxID=497321 RepID=UPI0002CDC220|nr:hypothetical protein [Thauera sp. 63]ENO79690.1 hypothetical protein C664_02240 [Thauera sp. 63]